MNGFGMVLMGLAGGLLSTVMLAADTGTLRIQIVDSEGAAIAAVVTVRPDAAGRQRPTGSAELANADQAGRFTRDLESGFFDVCVMSDAFVPVCQKVRVVAGAAKNITVKMKIDSSVTREIGDTFPTRAG